MALYGLLRSCKIVADGVVVLDGALDAAGHHHRSRLAADLVQRQHLRVEVVDHDLGLEANRVLVALDVLAQLLLRPLGVELGVVLDLLDELVVALHRRVAAQHIEDEALLDGLLHRVAVEGPVLDLAALLEGLAEDLEGLVLGRRGEGKVAGVGQQLARLHDAVDLVLVGLVLCGSTALPQSRRHCRGCLAALAGVRFIDDDRKATTAMLAANLVENERELLHRRDDDLLAALRCTCAGRRNGQHGRQWRPPERTA